MKTFKEFILEQDETDEQEEEIVYEKGVYISVQPTEITKNNIIKYMEKYLQGEDTQPIDELHCTISYSPQKHTGEVFSDEYTALATPKHFSLFNDDNSTLVLELESQLLDERHNYFKTKYGLVDTYPEYKPHITIVPKIKNIDYNSLPPIDFVIELNNETVQDLDTSK